MIKDSKEFERTMFAIENSTLNELLAWKDHIEDDADYYGEYYDERVYKAILAAIKQRVFDELIAKGYSHNEVKLFGDALSLLAANYEKENKKGNVK